MREFRRALLLAEEKESPYVSRRLVYSVFVLFCLLSALRDTLSEALFKGARSGANPIFVQFVYSVSTQLLALAVIGAQRVLRKPSAPLHSPREAVKPLILVNIFTLVAHSTFFLAISSPLGAGLNSLVDYGASPVFTAFAGIIVLRTKLDKDFWKACRWSVLGIGVFGLGRVHDAALSTLWGAGLVLALVSSLCSGFYRIYLKLLMSEGANKAVVVFYRMIGSTLITGSILVARPDWFRADLLLPTGLVGLCGFALPLFLMLFVIQRLRVQSFAALLFLMPMLTYAFSVLTGYAHLHWSDVLGGLIIFAAVVCYEIAQSKRLPQNDA